MRLYHGVIVQSTQQIWLVKWNLNSIWCNSVASDNSHELNTVYEIDPSHSYFPYIPVLVKRIQQLYHVGTEIVVCYTQQQRQTRKQ